MNFILTTLSITLGIVLASLIMVAIMLAVFASPKVMKWYSKIIFRAMTKVEEVVDELEENQ